MHADKIKTYVPAALLVVLAFAFAYQFVDPAPPSTLTLSAGQKGGAYYAHAERLRSYLKQRGITMHVLESAGTLQNIERLKSGVADIAFVQSGVVADDQKQLLSLGSMYYEPLWIFLHKGTNARFISDLSGKHIAVGIKGSGTRALAVQLLKDNGIDATNATLMELSTADATQALVRGRVDALFMVSAPDSGAIQVLQQHKNIHLMNIERAAAYARRINSLSVVTLPQGTMNLALNLPSEDTQLLASTATLVVNKTLHPALQDLLMQAASKLHSGSTLLSPAGQFPTPRYAGLPLSEEAERFYKSGPPFLQKFLPFWGATLLDRLKVMLLPFIALLIPLFKAMPLLYRWRIRSRIYRWYEELGSIDNALSDGFSASLLEDLDRIEADIRKVHVPLSYAVELYDLRLHLALIRDCVIKTRDSGV